MPGGGLGWGRVERGAGAGWGHNDVNSKSTHAQTTGIYSIFDNFAWVRHVPP